MTRVILSLLFAVSLFLSCESKKGSKDKFSELAFIDTVMVDPGDQIVMAADNMFLSGFSKDYSKLYHYDTKNGEIEVIDLNLLKLEKKLKVAQEGPEGVGNVFQFEYWGDSLFVFRDMSRLNFFNHKMEKTSFIDLRNSPLMKTALGAGARFKYPFCILENVNQVLVPVESFDNDFLHLAFIDFEKEEVEIIENSKLGQVNDYKIRVLSGI